MYQVIYSRHISYLYFNPLYLKLLIHVSQSELFGTRKITLKYNLSEMNFQYYFTITNSKFRILNSELKIPNSKIRSTNIGILHSVLLCICTVSKWQQLIFFRGYFKLTNKKQKAARLKLIDTFFIYPSSNDSSPYRVISFLLTIQISPHNLPVR